MVVKLRPALFVALLIGFVDSHDKYLGKCPDFKPMDGFNWDKFEGRWYAVEKFDTGSRCLTYDFKEDELGEREIVQSSEISSLKKLTVGNKVIYTGKLSFPRSAVQSDMIVRFPLSVLGSAEYILMDTDYENYAMLCTCQSSKFIFDILTWHRRSCTILQREPTRKTEYTDKMHQLLNVQVLGKDDGLDESDLPDHDFDVVRHDDNCNYKDNGKGLEIDVDKILESTKDEVNDVALGILEEAAKRGLIGTVTGFLLWWYHDKKITDAIQATVEEIDGTITRIKNTMTKNGDSPKEDSEFEAGRIFDDATELLPK